ncbi:MAG: alpha-amylase/4-alpha-glucanotransferase domain-containing protein, partial [bacterium]
MLRLLLVIHNHQPLGNLPEVFRKAYEVAYKPFLDVIRKHPKIKWALHCSGCLWEWFEAEEPGYLDSLREELASGRLEILTSGMWEPIQPLLTKSACTMHFDSMREFLHDRFGINPTGSWTTERVWEPSLAEKLSDAGIHYTLLDDSQLRASLPPSDEQPVWGYYRTEFEGKSVAIFPIDEKLRYMIPFKRADEAIGHLENLARTLPDNAAITYGDDGEKFGLWPHTYEWVFRKGWLDEFFGRLEASKIVSTMHPSDYLKLVPHARQRVYIPTSSYREMGIWTLYPRRNLAAEEIHKWVESNPKIKDIGPPHAAGFFRSFLVKYPESRYMHERVAELLARIAAADPGVKPDNSPDASPSSRALWHALRAQCNCAYWHGVFGGLYLNYLRFAVNRSILEAEKILSEAGSTPYAVRRIGPWHSDGTDGKREPDSECPVLMIKKRVHWVIDPETGQVIAAGHLKNRVDVIDVIARRFEAYHATMKESQSQGDSRSPSSIHDMVDTAPRGWREGYGNDRCRRGCFADRFLLSAPGLTNLAEVDYASEFGPESGSWSIDISKDKIILNRNDGAWSRNKEFLFNTDGMESRVVMTLKHRDKLDFSGWLYWEFNIGLLAENAKDRYFRLDENTVLPLGSFIEKAGITSVDITDEWTDTCIEINVPLADWIGVYPVKTLNHGEGGLELTYQGTAFV